MTEQTRTMHGVSLQEIRRFLGLFLAASNTRNPNLMALGELRPWAADMYRSIKREEEKP